jgi:hypothetical protein
MELFLDILLLISIASYLGPKIDFSWGGGVGRTHYNIFLIMLACSRVGIIMNYAPLFKHLGG